MVEFEANINLGTLDGITGFRLNGVAQFDGSDSSVAAADDTLEGGAGGDTVEVNNFGMNLLGPEDILI